MLIAQTRYYGLVMTWLCQYYPCVENSRDMLIIGMLSLRLTHRPTEMLTGEHAPVFPRPKTGYRCGGGQLIDETTYGRDVLNHDAVQPQPNHFFKESQVCHKRDERNSRTKCCSFVMIATRLALTFPSTRSMTSTSVGYGEERRLKHIQLVVVRTA